MHLYDRTTSAFPVSIGTSLAMESIFLNGPQPSFDPDRKIPNRVDLHRYQEIWFNVETLIRNIAGSVERSRFTECVPKHVLEILNSEIEILESLFQVEGQGTCRPIFYVSSFKSLRAQKKHFVFFRDSETSIQKSYDFKVDQIIKLLNRQTEKVRMLDDEIKPDRRSSALIVTHYPYDLLSHARFERLELLESHTGILKKRPDWNTKYAPMGQESLSHLPFHENLLFIFGDKTLLRPQSFKVRQKVLDMSIQDKWTPYTTLTKIHESFRMHTSHPADLQYLLRF